MGRSETSPRTRPALISRFTESRAKSSATYPPPDIGGGDCAEHFVGSPHELGPAEVLLSRFGVGNLDVMTIVHCPVPFHLGKRTDGAVGTGEMRTALD